MSEKRKILLIRDYSGMLNQMAVSLRADGFQIVHASISDAYKGNYGCDIDLESRITGINIVDQYINYIKLATTSHRYDVVHLQTPLLAGRYSVFLLPILKILRSKTDILSVSLAGDDYNYWLYGQKYLDYGPFDDARTLDLAGENPYYLSRSSKHVCSQVEKWADFLIPSCYEYAICHQESKKLTHHVPYVWDVQSTPELYHDPSLQRPIRILHGIGRMGFKGSDKIIEALRKLQIEFPNDIELILPAKTSYQQYRSYLEGCDVFVDQCNSYSYGMAAIEALALGKVVFSGAESDALRYMGINSCPVINIKPSTEDIYLKLKSLIKDRRNLREIGLNSRKFIRNFHSPSKVLPKIYDIWFNKK